MVNQLICVPGQRLALSDKYVSGRGTYEHHGYIHSTLAGIVRISSKDQNEIIEVHGINEQTIVPAADDVVTAMITVINQKVCKCLIKSIGDIALNRPYRAFLRREDVRTYEKDTVNMYECFRPGDIVLAKVLPGNEVHSYQLTTAENELGVVIAHSSEEGIPMVPISWTEMQCPKTFNKELRKVAKIIPENISVE